MKKLTMVAEAGLRWNTFLLKVYAMLVKIGFLSNARALKLANKCVIRSLEYTTFLFDQYVKPIKE